MQWVWDVTSKIASAPLASRPWRHLHVLDVFPADVYARMLQELPPLSRMAPLSYMTTNRHVLNIFGSKQSAHVPLFWRDFAAKLFPSLRCTLETAFGVQGSWKGEGGSIVYDKPGYSLVPHTDMPHRLITAVFYLPANDALAHQGTVLMRGRKSDPQGIGHEFSEEFRAVTVVPYLPNSALFFERTNWSYHAVMKTDAPRWTLSFDVFR